MSTNVELELMAHLMRRSGFGATRGELEARLAKGYEATVEELLYPGDDSDLEKDLIDRYFIEIDDMRQATAASGWWLYRMINSDSPLRERMTLFWHGLFATAYEKIMNGRATAAQIEMFRRQCLGDFRTMLLELSHDPAMIRTVEINRSQPGCDGHPNTRRRPYSILKTQHPSGSANNATTPIATTISTN